MSDSSQTTTMTSADYEALIEQVCVAMVEQDRDESERQLTDLLIEMLDRQPLTQSQAQVLLAYHKALMTGVLVP